VASPQHLFHAWKDRPVTDPAPTPAPDDSSDIVTPAPSSSGVGSAPSSGISPAPSSSGVGPADTPDVAPEPSGTPVGAAPARSGCLSSAAAILIAFLASGAFSVHIFTGWLT
jgi:hypothetical protein